MVATDAPVGIEGVNDAIAKYIDARKAFEAADQRYSAASRERTDALNRVNEAQKVFETAVDAVTKSAPRDSDWGRARQRQ